MNEPHANDLQPVRLRLGTAIGGHISRPLCRSVGLGRRVFELSLTFGFEVVGGSLGTQFQCWLSMGIEAFMSKMNTYRLTYRVEFVRS